ncbi:caspase-8-like [Takifugu rubripes]|uniref:Caspase-8-like n=1 Tax=Takifugu rubripes TaxID=31033 RepID=H2THL4_TAKRU|nr:caspase-8-like [Takifugu rubripes]|eukprot:XP_003975924.2 PREDICTED: caspase-8-like [Takifugu rubripes]
MEAVRRNKTAIGTIFCADYGLILNKVDEKKLITRRDYNNLKNINGEDIWGHVIALVDKIMNKGDATCEAFLNLLQTDDDIKSTYPELKNIQWSATIPLTQPVQSSSEDHFDGMSQECKRIRRDEQYELLSQPTGLCVIINNENFLDMKQRSGTNKDAQSLAEVFTWLGFRVLMCKDQTKEKMDRALNCFASLSDLSQLQEFDVKEWSGSRFVDLQVDPKHGDAFICCILSHGEKSAVLGIDGEPLCIKQIIRTFKATRQSALVSKPKMFLIQACQGKGTHRGVLLKDLQTDDCHTLSIPEEADILVATATVEDYVSFRHKIDGSWFIQSLCQELKEGCLRGEDMTTILHRVNSEVSQKEAFIHPGEQKQMPEVRFTLRKRLVLSPHTA